MASHAVADSDSGSAWDGGKSPFKVSYGKMFMWFFLVSDALTFSGLLIAYGFMRHLHPEVWPNPGDVFTHVPFIEEHIPLLYVGFMTLILIMSSVTMVLAVEAGHRNDKRRVIIWMLLTIIGGAMFVGSQAWEWFNFIVGTDHGAWRSILSHITVDSQFVNELVNGGYVSKQAASSLLVQPEVTVGQVQSLLNSIGNDALINKEFVSGQYMIGKSTGGLEIFQKVHGANMTVNEYGLPVFGNFFFFITGFHGFHVFSGVIINLVIFINVIKGTYEKRGHYEMVEKVGLYWHFVDLVWVFVFTFFYLL